MPPTHLKMKLNFSCLCFPVYDPFQQPGIETPLCMGGQPYCLPIQCFNVNKKQISNMLQSVQFSSVAQSCPTLCDPMNCSTPGPPVHHQLLEFTQTHVHRVSDAIQPPHPVSSPSPPASIPSILPASSFQFSSVQSLSCVQLFATPVTAAGQASLFITNS